MVRRGRIAVVLTLTLFTLVLAGVGERRRTETVAQPRPHGSRIAGAQTMEEAPVLDLFGNEITQAVATYKLDATGSLYEEHSPQTELPRLGTPKS